ncbi:hypothetical protein [Actinoplanes friuliensis]|jgi:hypothetical protein|uniref:Uncharacterized protein n=1 Tax=Actinoplanes friuliensis DSM 7358 TaxID=1246995 RepID=U5VVP5_9ACTN|nr:hypothetical protein [Actinoplanes friuliensis]AGZ39711.1 hypothetical protein AFR_07110 [Actinoplanes friuliensis DSM 7358]
MTQQNERLPAFGDEEAVPDGDSDFASEHSDTVVDPEITEGKDDGETESPRGWTGLDREGPP